MDLTPEQQDRASGVLLGCAVGDALGVPFEFKPPQRFAPEDLPLGMPGGGPFNFGPGEWSDDTQMTLCIARAAHAGFDLTTPKGLDRVANAFAGWYRGGPRDVGGQVSSVLGFARQGGWRAQSRRAAERFLNAPDNSAGNGSLMRTSPVALRHLGDEQKAVLAARRVSALTHADPDCLDACVIWTQIIRTAVLEGNPYTGLAKGLGSLARSRRGRWAELMAEAEERSPEDFPRNGWVVHAIQAAWSAVTFACQTGGGFEGGVTAAVSCGHDTDTVGAIAGAVLGATFGVSDIPRTWALEAHGWPLSQGSDLCWVALDIVRHA